MSSNTLSATARKHIGQWRARERKENEALPRQPINQGPGGYTCPELLPDPGIAPGRMVAHGLPSRVGDRLYWPNGRVTDLDHIEVTE